MCVPAPAPHLGRDVRDPPFKQPSPSVRSFARPSATQMLRAASRQAVDPPRRPIRRRLRKRLRRPVLTFADGRAFHREQRRYRYGNGCDGDSDNRQRQRRALLTLFRTWKARPLPCADSDSFLQFLHVPVTNVVFSGALRKCSCLVARHIAYVCVYLLDVSLSRQSISTRRGCDKRHHLKCEAGRIRHPMYSLHCTVSVVRIRASPNEKYKTRSVRGIVPKRVIARPLPPSIWHLTYPQAA